MAHYPFESQLDHIEQQFNMLSAALVDGHAPDVQAAAAAFQQLAVDFRLLVDRVGVQGLREPRVLQRVRAIGQGVPILRDTLFRRLAYVDRALATVVPVAQSATYAGVKPYGTALRHSGEFKAVSA